MTTKRNGATLEQGAPQEQQNTPCEDSTKNTAEHKSDAHVDLAMAERFLTLLDEDAEAFTFQTFDDSPAKRSQLAGHEYTTFDAAKKRLTWKNKAGTGVFVTVNETDGKGRRAENIVLVRAVFVDLDGSPLEPVHACALEPHIIVESSPGRWHAYWLVDGLALDQFTGAQKSIAERFSGDDSVTDLSRVMRLPGFIHRKGEPFQTRIVSESGARPYTAEEILREFPPVFESPSTIASAATVSGVKLTEGGRNNRLTSLAGSMRHRGMAREAIQAALLAENAANCDPPLSDKEVQGIAVSIMRYPPGESTTTPQTPKASIGNAELKAQIDALIAAIPSVEGKNEARKLCSAMVAIKRDSKLPGGKHDASSTIGFALCTAYKDSSHQALGRALCQEWDLSTGGNSVSVFDVADPNYSHGKGPVTTNSLFKLANASGWDGKYEPEWDEPKPLHATVKSEPYPVDALPATIRAAVEEVAGFVKAPLPLVASSALAALSLAAQAHIDVKRAERLQGPVGLFMLTIADSGERKSTCDGFFTTVIQEYEAAQAEVVKPELNNHKANLESWDAKRSGIKEKIRHLAKENKPTGGMEEAMRELERDKPEPPRVPRMLYADATPEALAYGLAKNWSSGGVVSAEGGIVFGAHGMGKDSVMRNLTLLNVLWDGGTQTIDRRTSESFVVKGARLTIAIQVQEIILREFFIRSGALARGTGFLARFLVAWPESTQGYRPFTEPVVTWPHLAAFHRRISAILESPVPINDDGALSPALLSMTPEAKSAWVEYHDTIEKKLASGGELYDVRDVASKSADNAARLAALFQLFEHGLGGAVGLEAFKGASRVAVWHLNESRRFFGELALPPELVDAERLDSWLIEYCRTNRVDCVATRQAQRFGPVRDKDRMKEALWVLVEQSRVRLVQDGRMRNIAVNPALLETAS